MIIFDSIMTIDRDSLPEAAKNLGGDDIL